MRVIRADVMGCASASRRPGGDRGDRRSRGVTIHGQLVHNEVVLDDLKARGLRDARRGRSVGEASQPAAPGGRVLITAHGISDRERRRLESAGTTLIDTTCPLVLRVHQAAQTLQAEGYHVLVIGRKGHVEVQGIIEDLDDVDVIESEADVRPFRTPGSGSSARRRRPSASVAAIRAAIIELNPDAEIRFVDTVCLPTKEHQRALERMLDAVDAVVVVGGKDSNNTRELVERCRQRGRPVFHVQSAADLDPRWFKGFATVGLTAGTSTLDRTIDEVHRALIAIGSHDFSGPAGILEHQADSALGHQHRGRPSHEHPAAEADSSRSGDR